MILNPLPRIKAIRVVLVWFLLAISYSRGEGEAEESSITSSTDEAYECGFYLAESSIPNSGAGMYTVKHISKGDPIGEADANILNEDLEANNGGKIPRWTHFDYFWMAEWRDEFLAAKNVHVNAFPVGSLANFHTFFKNTYPGEVLFDNVNVTRFDSPTAGSFSYYTRVFEATRDILAGEEIFANYGEPWLDDHHMHDVPREKHFRRAERVMNELSSLRKKLSSSIDAKFITALNKIVSLYDDKTASLLPATDDELANANALARKTLNVRSMDWILKHGVCIDTLSIQHSTIPQAGLGAFAKFSFKNNDLIIPMPLLHIRNKNGLDITIQNDKAVANNRKQILLNYCYGHSKSNLILCPSTHGTFINHKPLCAQSDSNEECSMDAPNAKIIWSSGQLANEWLSFSLDDLENNISRGLSFDIVATRDITQGEEIFIDYGIDWQNAWNNHMATWKAPIQYKNSYAFSKVMNDENEDELFYTVYEQIQKPYPDNINTICAYWEQEGVSVPNEEERRYKQNVIIDQSELEGVLKKYAYEGDIFVQSPSEEYYWPCQIYERSDDGDLYVVRILQNVAEDTTSWSTAEKPRFLFNLPFKSIMFGEKPYAADQFLKNVFRYPIGIPDDMFPDKWMDVLD